jgi:hypothetical protein
MKIPAADLSRWLTAAGIASDSQEARTMRARYVDEQTDTEIAAALGIEEVTVRVHACTAWKKIREQEKAEKGRISLVEILQLVVFQVDTELAVAPELHADHEAELLTLREYCLSLLALLRGKRKGGGHGGPSLRDPLVSLGDVMKVVEKLGGRR